MNTKADEEETEQQAPEYLRQHVGKVLGKRGIDQKLETERNDDGEGVLEQQRQEDEGYAAPIAACIARQEFDEREHVITTDRRRNRLSRPVPSARCGHLGRRACGI